MWAFSKKVQLAAIMDLIDGYPEKEIAFVGFFMLEQTMQGRGAGTRLIDHLCGRLKGLGFKASGWEWTKATRSLPLLEEERLSG